MKFLGKLKKIFFFFFFGGGGGSGLGSQDGCERRIEVFLRKFKKKNFRGGRSVEELKFLGKLKKKIFFFFWGGGGGVGFGESGWV